MKLVRATFMVSVLALLGGCAVVPYDAQPYGYYRNYEPAPVYYPPPVYYGPSFGVVIEGDRHRHRGHRRHHWRH